MQRTLLLTRICGALLLASTMQVWAHGDVTPQAIDITGLEPIKDSDTSWVDTNPYSGNERAIEIGKHAFAQNCARCHGIDAISGGIAPDLREKLPLGQEGDDIFKGTTDVVVCDGFVGNVALKTTEGLAHMMGKFLTQEFKRNWLTKLMALGAFPVLKAFKRRLDPRRYNGASFLGLRGIVVKSHGGADSVGFYHAIHVAMEEAQSGILKRIQAQLEIEHLTTSEQS